MWCATGVCFVSAVFLFHNKCPHEFASLSIVVSAQIVKPAMKQLLAGMCMLQLHSGHR